MSPLKDLLEDEDAPGPAEEAERQEMALALSEAIDQLPEREQLLLALYYQEELTMKEISKVMSVSESRVCQLHMQAIMRLRGVLHAQRVRRAYTYKEKYYQTRKTKIWSAGYNFLRLTDRRNKGGCRRKQTKTSSFITF